jgi:hypothetical protein
VSSAKDREQYPQWGTGSNPWFKSVADLQAENRPGIALRKAGESSLWDNRTWPLAENGTFAISGVPAGSYDVLLVLREVQGTNKFDHVLEPALQQVEVVIGKTVRLSLETPEKVQSMSR